MFNDPKLTPEKYLLWFHHLSWDYRLKSGRTLWDELVMHYSRGVDAVRAMRDTWATLAPYVDEERYAETAAFLAIQEKEARWWRDACLAYFQSLSKRPLPSGFAPPERTLAGVRSDPYAIRARQSRLDRRALSPLSSHIKSIDHENQCTCPVELDSGCRARALVGNRRSGARRLLLHEVFADHAVLQRDRPIPVWGEAAGGDRVSVSIGRNHRRGARGCRTAIGVRAAAHACRRTFTLSVRTQSGRASRSAMSWWAMCTCVPASRTWNCR